MKRSYMAVFVLGLLCPTAALSITGNDLYAECIKPDASSQSFCFAYTIGVVEGIGYGAATVFASNLDPAVVAKNMQTSLRYCVPETATNRQIVDVVNAYLGANPSIRHEPAEMLVYLAVATAFPCEETP